MCEHKQAREAQNAAAQALTTACRGVCPKDGLKSMRQVWNETADEPIPDRFNDLLGRLQ